MQVIRDARYLAHETYDAAMREAEADLDDALAHVEAAHDEGLITLAQAARERSHLFEGYVALSDQIRRHYLKGSS